ncbi:MAG: AAA family ATPase [Methanosarcinales archaeon]
MVKVVYVCGLPGTGKNTVLAKVMERIQSNKDIKVVSFGDVIDEVVKKDFPELEVQRDKIRTAFSYEEQKSIIYNALSKIIHRFNDSEVLFLHGHSVLSTHYGYLPGFPTILYKSIKDFYSETPFNISLLVHIIAKPEEIAERRKKDKTRNRDIESITEIKNHLELSTMAIHSIAFNMFVPLIILTNSDGCLDKVADEFCRVLVNREVLSEEDIKK